MGLAEDIEKELKSFADNTEGILGSSVILSSQALMIAEQSSAFESSVIEGTSARIMQMSNNVLQALLQKSDYELQAITIQEKDHYIYVRPVNEKYYVVVITNTKEASGLRELNVKTLIQHLKKVLP